MAFAWAPFLALRRIEAGIALRLVYGHVRQCLLEKRAQVGIVKLYVGAGKLLKVRGGLFDLEWRGVGRRAQEKPGAAAPEDQ